MILHVDMDAFYASVEMRDQPELQGKPVVVGGKPEGRGVVAAASYEARKYGIHSAMPAARAKRLCPGAIFLPPRLDYYGNVSRQIRDIFHQYTSLVEPLSLDEAFLDVTGSTRLFGSSVKIAQQIKQNIADRLQLVASVGVASNKFLAKLASDLEKPDGFVIVDPDRIQHFLDALPVGRLWGVGRVTSKELQRLGVKTIRDMRALPLDTLQQQFGEHGQHLWKLSRGIDERNVIPDRDAKSISHETTFATDIDDMEVLRAWAVNLTDQVARRLRRDHLRGRTVQLKVRFSDFHTITRSTTLPQPTDMTQEIWEATSTMLATRLPARHLAVRLLGVGVSSLEHKECTQLGLFDSESHDTLANLDRVTDQICEKFGSSSLGRASGLKPVPPTTQSKPGDSASEA